MKLIDIQTAWKYLFASVFVGILLGISGAFAAQGFRSGIVAIAEYLDSVSYTHLTLPTKRIV